MSPPSAHRKDELLTMLVSKLDQLEGAVTKLRESAARIEAGQEQAKEARNHWNSQEWPAHQKLHEDTAGAMTRLHASMFKRIDSLEETRSQARGAATMLRVLWVVGPVAGGILAALGVHWAGLVK